MENLIIYFFYPKRINKANIRPKRAIASVKAKPNTAKLNSLFSELGLIDTAYINPENTIPIPEPRIDTVAQPAPIGLKDCKKFKSSYKLKS